MLDAHKKIPKFKNEQNRLRIQFIVCTDTESLLEKNYKCDNNLEEFSTTKINTHFLMYNSKRKHDFYGGIDTIKKLCADLRKHATELINCEKKEIIPLTEKQEKKQKNINAVTYANKNSVTCLMKLKMTLGFVNIFITQRNIVGLLIVSVT